MAESPRVQLSLKGRLLSEVAFAGPQLRIGRMRENDVVVNNLAVSRFHAVLKREGDGFVLEDLGSENGTQLNGERINGSAPISSGDVIQLGKYELRLALEPGQQVAAAPKAKPSDAWDASQTYLELGPVPAKPAAMPSPAGPPPPSAQQPELALALDEAEEESALPMLDALELEPEAEPAPEATPDPDGVFAFGDGDVAAADSDRGQPLAAAALPTPNPEHTSLFDFAAPAEPDALEAALGDAAPAAPAAPSAAPAPTLYAGVIVQRDGKLHLLRAWEVGELCAGRAPECDIVLADAGVSRRHAIFTRSGERYGVRDLGSVNGIYVNGQRTKQHELSVGDVVRIESFELTFVLDHSPIGSEVSGPAPVPGKPQELASATQFSLEAPAREQADGFELAFAPAEASTEPAAASAAFEEITDGLEILAPADDPFAGEAQSADAVASLDLPESDLVGSDEDDEGEDKEATVQGTTGAQALRVVGRAERGALRVRLTIDRSELSPRAREALAVLEAEEIDLTARLSFEPE